MELLIELQHVNVKLLLADAQQVDLEPLIPVFHGWIQEQAGDGLWLDVADYRHVPEGPGVILIGFEGNYSVDNTDNRLGVRYNRKAVLNGDNQDRLRQAARAALTVCQRLEAEPRLGGKLRFNGQDVEIFINDRLLAPNSNATRDALWPDIESFAQGLFRGIDYSVSYTSDPRRLFGVSMKANRQFTVADLLQNLA